MGRILILKICDSSLSIIIDSDVASTSNQKNQVKIGGMFLMHITSQIVNMKTIGDFLGFRKWWW